MLDPTRPRPCNGIGARLGSWGLSAYAFLIPFEGIGHWRVDRALGLRLADLAMLLAVPAFAPLLWRNRDRLVGSRLLIACVAMALALTASGLVNGSSLRSTLKVWGLPYVAAACAALAADRRDRLVIRAAVAGGTLALTASVLGYLLSCTTQLLPRGAFVHIGRHPLFDMWPRLTGSFGSDTQAMGEYTLVWTALVTLLGAGHGARRLGPWLTLGCVTEVLSFSRAWLGAPIVAGAVALRMAKNPAPGLVKAAALAASVGLAGAGWIMNLGIDTWPQADSDRRTVDCARIDLEHQVAFFQERKRCVVFRARHDRGGSLTRYMLANRTSIAAFLENPWFGVGPGNYGGHALRFVAKRYQLGPDPRTNEYATPHNTYLGLAAEAGILGVISLVGLLATLWRRRCDVEDRTLWLTTCALMLVGFTSDVLHQRYLWLLLGLLSPAKRDA
ncbi:MAG: O-antigen ligase family protein [Proteobacteria bacterium]|nr:O-antigen ligase family protein [Pseudomonadota bacterium]